jgi:hypothetical protein
MENAPNTGQPAPIGQSTGDATVGAALENADSPHQHAPGLETATLLVYTNNVIG